MKLVNLSLIITTSLFISSLAYAKPPEPEPGKRWVLNNAYSDEFNGNSLDKAKWRNKHKSWKGRPPAKFDPKSVAIKKGNLEITNSLLDKPEGKYTIAGGAVQSLNQTAYHGYYESRFKASRINMSTTFWLSNDNINFEGDNHLGENCPQDKWSMELDIVEAVGGVMKKAFTHAFRDGMQYNTHVWYSSCNNERIRFSKGANVAEGDGTQAVNNKLPNGEEVWQNYNTYAAWWKNENEVSFYLNNGFAGHINVDTTLLEKPYNRAMQMQLLTETYNWGRPLPTKDELANKAINTSYYDWVRSYYYADVNAEVAQELPFSGKPVDIFKESVRIKKSTLIRNKLAFSYLYETDENVLAEIVLLKGKNKIATKTVNLKAGYGHVETSLTLAFAAAFDKTTLVINLTDVKGNKITSSKAHKVKLNAK